MPIITKKIIDSSVLILLQKFLQKISSFLNAIQPHSQSYNHYCWSKIDLNFVVLHKRSFKKFGRRATANLIQQNESYFNIWDEYVRYEQDAITKSNPGRKLIHFDSFRTTCFRSKIICIEGFKFFLKTGDTLILLKSFIIEDFEQNRPNTNFWSINSERFTCCRKLKR